jgi:ParB family chromosome partitioning protein
MSTPHLQFVAVLDGQRCRGHVLARGKTGFEAFDTADVSIGLHNTPHEAAAALSLARPRPGRATIATKLVSSTVLPIADVKVGPRHRRDLGDIAALARNIEEVGLLHPIVVRPDGTLVAGERRLAAFKDLGRDTIPVTVIDLEKVAVGAYAENTFRKAFTPSELADIGDAIEPLERAAAKERQREHGGTAPGKHSGEIPASDKGRALDKVAKIVGKDRKTIQKARAVRDAARADPERFGQAARRYGPHWSRERGVQAAQSA